VLEPDDGKPSSPVLRGLGASNGARPLDNYRRISRVTGDGDHLPGLRIYQSPVCRQVHPGRQETGLAAVRDSFHVVDNSGSLEKAGDFASPRSIALFYRLPIRERVSASCSGVDKKGE
jgi:hypothetical protein